MGDFTVIDNSAPTSGGIQVHEYGSIRKAWNWLAYRIWYWRLRRWLPRLVWIGDELDVLVQLSEHPLNPDDPMASLAGGNVHIAEDAIRALGVNFDTGSGGAGRDWEWDYSLAGPISVRFKGRAAKPERRIRQERCKPNIKLVE
jgi:hypothetical protein